ncbi:ankyrin repeat domain protein [Nitzschia inconspicua]|uniref:Ankyrin repeat domain protein n=1 Tax=Nitzschia inconspicua TaxID=303405 RepID=A0A9K3KDV5_9STRA|nr:ankyrin repeat domain protein [Nitzschia inconspicua]
MHAIARRIAARLTSRGRSNQLREEDEEDDDESDIFMGIPNWRRNSTPQLIPFERPSICFTPSNNSICNVENDSTGDGSGSCSSDPLGMNLGMLYTFAKAWAWPALAHRCETHPWEASTEIVNADGDTALHWAVFGNPPLYVIEALLQACPDLVNASNSAKQLPLHLACCYRASFMILQALIQVNPATLAVRNGFGFYPLHILCDCGCRPECLEVVLQYNQAMATVTERDYTYGRTPLYILNQRKNIATFGRQVEELRRLRQHERDAINCGNWTSGDQTDLESKINDAKEMDFWRKARMLIVAEYLHRQRKRSVFKDHATVEACLRIEECPPSLLEYAILAHSEELLITNEQGDLPLHHVCASSVDRRETQWLALEILNANPQAARVRNKHRKLALEIYVGSSVRNNKNTIVWSEALRRLILAHPAAIGNLQIENHIYPLILERLGCDRNTAGGIFELIRASPGLFSSFANRA